MTAAVLPAILFGAGLTLLTAYALGALLLGKTPAVPEIRLALGAAALSFLVLLSLLAGMAMWQVFLALGTATAVAWRVWGRRSQPLPEKAHPDTPSLKFACAAIFGAYGLWYFVNALAPETVADGVTYHLGLPFEYIRLGGFPNRMAFFDMTPQGMEMLYTMAFAFGRHSGAKLVEFAFLAATLPLIFRIGRLLDASGVACFAAAAVYFCAPVVGITGSSSYNDAAAVFFALAAFYLLLRWRGARDSRYLFLAGVLAGFCYNIKYPGIFAVGGAVLFVLATRRVKAAAVVAAGAALVMAPWIIRNAVITGNPVAPLMNAVFPNRFFHLATERELTANLQSFSPVSGWQVPWELAFGDRLTGTFGPVLLLLPLALLGWRKRSVRLCVAAAVLLAGPWFFNTGARFLMPAFAFAALALAMALPRPAAWALVALQAVLCWPHVIESWETRFAFRLHEFPLAAALRITPEAEYVGARVQSYAVAKMIEAETPANARILALTEPANAYLARDARLAWQSAETDCLRDMLHLASQYRGAMLYDWKATFPAQTVRALRFRVTAGDPAEWDIHEVELYSGADRVYISPQSSLRAWPNRWETPLAFDGNPATRWRTWEPMRPGMFVEMELENPQVLTSAVLISKTPLYGVPLEFHARGTDGRWRLLTRSPSALPRPVQDVRFDAARELRRAGYRYVLAPTGEGGDAPIGNLLLRDAPLWGVEVAGDAGRFLLFRVK